MISSAARVLVVEDEQDILALLAFVLETNGMGVTKCSSGEEALRLLESASFDLCILDIMLPGIDGIELCSRIRRNPLYGSPRVLMLSAKAEECDVLRGLEIGADDYVTKPFSPKVLLARVKKMLKEEPSSENSSAPKTTEPRTARIKLDASRARVWVDGEVASLTATEFAILQLLIQTPGRVYSRDQIIDAARGHATAVTERSVDVHVASLRKKLASAGEMIETVRGLGYRFAELQ